ncbi:MAG: phosphoenolpyruvate carboxykinase (GTP), partial [Pseudomonadales bacterium]|nr:phosphoenolpyruvate carboxykinase (GTP) [Pseudomonadales bacterium]
WFRKDDEGRFMWPGFGENSRILKWVFERCAGTADAIETPIGNLPGIDGLDFSGLDISDDEIATLLRVEIDGWLSELPLIEDYYNTFQGKVPEELFNELAALKQRLEEAKQEAA